MGLLSKSAHFIPGAHAQVVSRLCASKSTQFSQHEEIKTPTTSTLDPAGLSTELLRYLRSDFSALL